MDKQHKKHISQCEAHFLSVSTELLDAQCLVIISKATTEAFEESGRVSNVKPVSNRDCQEMKKH